MTDSANSGRDSAATYVDAKGRLRWTRNDEIGELLKKLYDFLVIGNYPEEHAARYPRLAHAISRHPESIEAMHQEDRLDQFPGVSGIISGIIGELIETGTCKKMDEGDEFFTPPPRSVLELTDIQRLGAKTARTLYQDHGIASLEDLDRAIADGNVAKIKGIGRAMIATMQEHIARVKSEA